ncbi:ABC transporter substrate-binding protein [Desulfofustis limnaeus]|jgi:branched-chain amino acid transport system substrate-binding protein|uniref:Branched-chain amino acid ABC transporter substrate-binding protein n=1 Tax=Desulfofustis limnaeus TaxID=2740163 RepID=A0ABM7WC07_9BACT|nr:ABC transporter substrate-binding protein [Desulfofustis limnaeus]MDX9895742.1 ABC transporter substrate-binding protein [Desulfofustis sp.]BDD88494.1 branched-chain amino acid ABC transporter substrate-binding protein [Desulfofustis limnaeus]
MNGHYMQRVGLSMLVGAMALLLMLTGPAVSAEIKIGAILAETGPASFLGGPESRALQMLAEQINAGGGINGDTIKLVIKDSGGSPEKAISFAKQLIEEEQVFAIIGPSTSGETLKIKKMCEEARMILISCASAELIVDPVAAYVFKTAPSDSFAARRIFMTMNDLGISRIAIVTGNTGFGNAGRTQMTEIAPEYGIEIVVDEVYDKDANDLSALVAKMKAHTDIQAVVNWSVVPAQSIIAKNIRQAGWDVPIFQSHGFANIKYVEAAGAAAEGIVFPASRLIVANSLPEGPQKSFLMKFKTDYESRFNEAVSTFGGHTYDALMILAQAIETAGTDRDKVREAIENLRGYYGTAGEFNFSATDHSGLGIDAFAMLTVKDGRFVLYQP